MKRTLSYLLAALSTSIYSQTLDVNLLELNYGDSSEPRNIVIGTNKIFFSAEEMNHGEEVWIHDLLTGETYMAKDINPGYSPGIGNTPQFTVIDDILYFIGSSVMASGESLWRSDGTESGTYMVKDILPDSPLDANIHNMIAVGSTLYFTVNDNINGNELWKSDGTESGTTIVADLNPGAAGTDITDLFVMNNQLYFSAYLPGIGREVWKTDGSSGGTLRVKPGLLHEGGMIVMGNNLYFNAYTPALGTELWKSDGTTDGTVLVKEFAPGSNGLIGPIEGIAANGYFVMYVFSPSGARQLWKSDGTDAGTILLKQINAAQDGVSSFKQFTVYNNSVYFLAGDFSGYSQVWKTDGTTAGTQMLHNMGAGQRIYGLNATNEYLIFGSGNNSGIYTWVSSGTVQSLFQIPNIKLSFEGEDKVFSVLENKLFFAASSGGRRGIELWESNGTIAATLQVADIAHTSGGITPGGTKSAAVLDNKLIFFGSDGVDSLEPYSSNGTLQGTGLIKNINTNAGEGSIFWNTSDTYGGKIITKAGNRLFFKGYNGSSGYEILSTDGTEENSGLTKNIAPGNTGSISENTYFMEYNGIFYFKANDQVHGEELWRSDGTEAGTYLVKDINPGSASGVTATNRLTIQNKDYAVMGGHLYFKANDGSGQAIWRTDGTDAGTIKVITTAGTPTILEANSNKIFFSVNTQLWSSDGTQAGTVLINNYSYSDSNNFRKVCIFNNNLFFFVYTSNTGYSLLKSDGTIEGTIVVYEQLPSSNVRNVLVCGDYAYFAISTNSWSENGDKLWRTDGTEEGTILITNGEIENFLDMSSLECYSSNLFFLAMSPGSNIRVTNAQSTGTDSINLNVLNNPNIPHIESISGFADNKIFLTGITQESGRELYVGGIDEFLNTKDFDSGYNGIESDVTLYPNPTNSIINIAALRNEIVTNIEIYDLTGKKVASMKNDDTILSIDISGLSQGIYMAKIKTTNSVTTKKIIRN